jgi:hypothetical protein
MTETHIASALWVTSGHCDNLMPLMPFDARLSGVLYPHTVQLLGNAALARRWLRDERMHIWNRYGMSYQTRSGLFQRTEGRKLLLLITAFVLLAFAWVYVW